MEAIDAPRVCLIGPECTGKTTLAEQLADHFGVAWIAEFAREYARRVGRMLTADDVEPIARGQMALEDAARQPTTNNLLILDTDLISTVVYARHYYGTCPEWIETEARARKADLYLLTEVDVPWTIDDVRDSAAPRETLHRVFATTLETYGAEFVAISGDRETRFAAAVAAIAARLHVQRGSC
ncbi:MAG TPA: ATP-binding protein [Thermoanaerobaculia bacterium]|jgi:NadR type nicotinamide-nucleotide adenylyltransferase|nr:ATP-binding protein [Thermoanaerobaculia bacterium]